MAGDERWTPERELADRRRREEALRDLARSRLGGETEGLPNAAPGGAQPAPSAGSGMRRLLVVGLVIVLVLAGVGGYLALHGRSGGSAVVVATPQAPVVLRPASTSLRCQQDIAWSPDGKRVAVLGYGYTTGAVTSDCPAYAENPNNNTIEYIDFPGEIEIYDAAGRASPTTLNLDTMVNAALHLQPPSNVHPFPRNAGGSGIVGQIVEYGQMLWSPDGTQLIVTFDVPVFTGDPSNVIVLNTVVKTSGVLQTDLAGKVTHVVSRDMSQGNTASSGTWNLATGTYTPYAESTSATAGAQGGLPLALNYTWSVNGASETLQPGQTLAPGTAPSAPPLAAVGTRTGASFSVWQSAQISTVPTYDKGVQSLIPATYLFSLPLFSWSPDGRFSADASLSGLLETGAAPDAATLRNGNLSTLAVLPIRDEGLRAALAALDVAQLQSANPYANQSIDVVWSPDGKRLATLLAVQNDNVVHGRPTVQTTVTVYDCASGKVLRTFSPSAANNPFSDGVDALAWSPDGSHLLAYTAQLAQVTIWDVRELK